MYKDEFEFEATDGNTYYVSVDFNGYGEVLGYEVKDGIGEDVSEDSSIFEEIKEEIDNREYKPEVHSVTFDFYEQQLDHFNGHSDDTVW